MRSARSCRSRSCKRKTTKVPSPPQPEVDEFELTAQAIWNWVRDNATRDEPAARAVRRVARNKSAAV